MICCQMKVLHFLISTLNPQSIETQTVDHMFTNTSCNNSYNAVNDVKLLNAKIKNHIRL